jgi:prepilin-type N-terminal cleavage/methylation domain-containing protein
MKGFPDSPRDGLTLVEVLVVLVLLALLAAFLLPTLPHSHGDRPHALRTAANGAGIYKQIFAQASLPSDAMDFFADSDSPYYGTSTEYFRWLMRPRNVENPEEGAGVLAQDFSPFVIGDIRPPADLESFSAVHNPWSVVADTDVDTAPGTPFLISRHVNETRLKDWRPGTEVPLEHVGEGRYSHPLDGEFLIVIRHGGGAEVLTPPRFLWDVLNPTAQTHLLLNP